MRNRTGQRRSFPLATKLGIGFLLAILLPTIFLTLLFFFSRQEIDRGNVEAYVRQVGQRQRQVLVTTFDRANETLGQFVEDSETNQLLLGLLLQDVRITPSIPLSTAAEVSAEMNTALLNTSPVVFREAGVVDRDGTVLASAGESVTSVYAVGSDVSESLAFTRIQQARADNPNVDRVITVSQRGTPVIEIAQVVRLRNTDNVAGYMVGVVDIEQSIEPILSFADSTFPANSLLLSDGGVMIAPEESQEIASQSTDTLAVERARDEETGYREYQLVGGTGEEVGGYYARIQGTPFVLITQVPVAAVLRQPLNYFTSVGAFVLIAGVSALLLIALVALYDRHLTAPLVGLQQAMRALGSGDFSEPVDEVTRRDEIGELARTFVVMRQQLELTMDNLQERVEARSRDMRTTQEISRTAVTNRNMQTLMDEVVALIVERFPNIYHAQIFLLSQDGRYAVLRSSTGEAGKKLLQRGHRLGVGSLSVIGQATNQRDVIIARDASSSEVHKHNEFLSETRAELAIPLRVGDDIIGALDVQSRDSRTFDEDQQSVLQTLADQIAVAIENARLYEESLRRMQSVQMRMRNQTLRAWQDYMFENRTQRLVRWSGTQTDTDLDSLRQQALQQGQAVVGKPTDRKTIPIAVPLRLRDEIIGVVASELPLSDYSGNKVLLAEDLASRLGESLDNTRLFEQSQRATQRERMVNEISAKLTARTDVNDIFQTAVEEVGRALRAPQVSIRLQNTQTSPEDDDSQQN